MTAPLVLPGLWARGSSPEEAAPLASPLRVPLVVNDASWLFDALGGVEEADVELDRPLQVDRPAWVMLLVPLAVALLASVAYLLRLAPPGWLLLSAALAACVGLAVQDHRSLAAQGISAPNPALALVTPAYLLVRATRTGDTRPLLAWFPLAAAGLLLLALVADGLAPARVASDQVERELTRALLAGALPVEPATGEVTCPGFGHLWPGRAVRCTATDDVRSAQVEVTVEGRHGPVSWQPLTP